MVASRLTEIVVKTHENVGVVSSYLSGFFVDLLDILTVRLH